MSESTSPPDRTDESAPIQHLVARQEPDGRVVILGLDADGRAVYTTTLERRV